MVTKKEFFTHMYDLYDEQVEDHLYKLFKEVTKITDKGAIQEIKDLISMNKRERLAYRFALAANGREYTPRQVDLYLSALEYALENMIDS